MLNHVEELKRCKTVLELNCFANRYAGNSEYANNFRKSLKKETDFSKALTKVWNFALQQEGKYFLGREGIPKIRSGGAITGLECHSESHRQLI